MEPQTVSFRVNKDDFSTAVSWVARSLHQRPSLPVLKAMIITASESGLELSAYNFETSATTMVSAEVSDPGRIAVAGRLLAEIVGALPNKPVELHADEQQAYFTCGSARFELPLIPLDDYPDLPDLPEVTGTVDPAVFNEAVGQVATAAGKDDNIPMLTGVHMKMEGNSVTLAATDRFRLAVRTFPWSPVSDKLSSHVLIPAKTLQEHARMVDSAINEPVEIALGTEDAIGKDGLFGVHTRNRSTTTRMLDVEFPNYSSLLPKKHTSVAVVEIAPLLEAIKRMSLVTERTRAQIRMNFSEGQVLLAAGATDAGQAQEVVPCHYEVSQAAEDDSLLVAFNAGLLREGLSTIKADSVMFGFTQSSQPAVLLPKPEGELTTLDSGEFASPASDFIYLLMPVRVVK